MRILALETTERIGTLAAMCDGKLLLELELDSRQRTAESLAPGLQDLLRRVRWLPADVELVAVTTGPGSFTGLRVGVVTAKTFAYSVGAEVLGIDTLEAIAAAAPAEVSALAVAVDAQRGDVVAQSWRRDADGWFRAAGTARLVAIDDWLAGLDRGTLLSGPVLGKLAARLPDGVTPLPPQFWSPTAAMVAKLAARDHAAGRRDDLWCLVPRYSRQSAAEEKWQQRMRQPDGSGGPQG